MNGADILMYLFLIFAVTVCLWVSWSAGKAHSARLYQAELATARAAARRYRADLEREAEYNRLQRLSKPVNRGGAA